MGIKPPCQTYWRVSHYKRPNFDVEASIVLHVIQLRKRQRGLWNKTWHFY